MDATVDGGRVPSRAGLLVGGLGALVGALALYQTLPPSGFRTHAVLTLIDAPAQLRPVLAQVAANSILSKPVIASAAAALVANDGKAPAPGLAERLAVTAGTGGATSKQSRLAEAIEPMVDAAPGTVPGTVDITARAAEGDRAARIADAVAEAFVMQQDDAGIRARSRREEKNAAWIEGLRAAAAAAHKTLSALGGSSEDPVQARASAAAQITAAEARLAGIKVILATGSPPVSDRKDLPPALATPQAAYLDLKAQLATQSETLGERHTTIIALREGVARAAAVLNGEWKRLTRIAEADVVAARERAAVLRKAEAGDPQQIAARDAARRAAQTADGALAQALTRRDPIPEEPSFRLVARAPVPTSPEGFGATTRTLLAGLGGIAGAVLALGLRALVRRRRGRPAIAMPNRADRSAATKAVSLPSSPVASPVRQAGASSAAKREERRMAPVPRPVAREEAMSFFDDEQPQFPVFRPRVRETVAPPAYRPRARPMPAAPLAAPVASDELDLLDAMHAILAEIEAIAPGHGRVPTIMVAANTTEVGTTPVALALGLAAAQADLRVLLIETDRPVPSLAAAVDLDADPVLIDLFGALRVAVKAERGAGLLTLSPVFRDAARLASDLARSRTTPLVDDLAEAFDLILIDGGAIDRSVAVGWTADAFLRVGLSASQQDDAAFRAVADIPVEGLLATILASDIEIEHARPRAPRAKPVLVAVPQADPPPAAVAPLPRRASTAMAPLRRSARR